MTGILVAVTVLGTRRPTVLITDSGGRMVRLRNVASDRPDAWICRSSRSTARSALPGPFRDSGRPTVLASRDTVITWHWGRTTPR